MFELLYEETIQVGCDDRLVVSATRYDHGPVLLQVGAVSRCVLCADRPCGWCVDGWRREPEMGIGLDAEHVEELIEAMRKAVVRAKG